MQIVKAKTLREEQGLPDALLHHSDHGVACSMSRSGNVWNNAAMENFFSPLKTQRTARRIYRTTNEWQISSSGIGRPLRPIDFDVEKVTGATGCRLLMRKLWSDEQGRRPWSHRSVPTHSRCTSSTPLSG
jgi:hypothetical protein